MLDGKYLEIQVRKALQQQGLSAVKASDELDRFYGTDLLVDGLHVGVTCSPVKDKVIKDFEKARKVTQTYVEVYFDDTFITDDGVEAACTQAVMALDFLKDKKGFFLVTLDNGTRPKIDFTLQQKMAHAQ
jgi:hypothetical protein